MKALCMASGYARGSVCWKKFFFFDSESYVYDSTFWRIFSWSVSLAVKMQEIVGHLNRIPCI